MNMTAFGGLLLTSVATFFAMCNPIASTPVFISMTTGDDDATRKAVARRATMVAFAIVVIVAVAGKLIGELFGISLPAFRIASGYIVFMIGYQMVSGKSHGAQTASDSDIKHTLEHELDKAVSPLGIPLLAGGGTISAAIVFSATDGIEGAVATIVGFGIIITITYFMFLSGDAIENKMGQSGMNAITRIMGLILTSIGVGILLDGVAGALNIYIPTISSLLGK